MKKLLKAVVLSGALLLPVAVPQQAKGSTIFWSSSVYVPGWGQYSLCEDFPGTACGSAFITPPATCEGISWWDILPQEFLAVLQYIANMLGGTIHLQGECQ